MTQDILQKFASNNNDVTELSINAITLMHSLRKRTSSPESAKCGSGNIADY